MKASWKGTKNGKTVVDLLPGTGEHKKFTLPALLFSAQEIAGFLDESTDLVKVQSRAEHEGADGEGNGGVKHKRKGLDNPADLAETVRSACGLEKRQKRERKPATETANGATVS